MKKIKRRTRNTIGKRSAVGGQSIKAVGFKNIHCFFCHENVKVDKDTKTALCGTCTVRAAGNAAAPKAPAQKIVEIEMVNGLPMVKSVTHVSGKGGPVRLNMDGTPRKKRAPNGSVPKKIPSGRPRGWHLKKKFVDVDGVVFRFGVCTNKKTVAARKSESATRKVAKSAAKYIKQAKKSPVKKATKKRAKKPGRKVVKRCVPSGAKRFKTKKTRR